MADFSDVVNKYKNEYFRHLVIEHHLNELHDKMHKLIADDETPFQTQTFLKELADLYILLNLEKHHDPHFNATIQVRREKFISKVKA